MRLNLLILYLLIFIVQFIFIQLLLSSSLLFLSFKQVMAEQIITPSITRLSTTIDSSNNNQIKIVSKKIAEDMLRQIERASQNLTFYGTIVQQKGQNIFSSEITRLVEKEKKYEKISALDGDRRKIFIHDNKKFVINSDKTAIAVKTIYLVSSFPNLIKLENIPRILNFYQLISSNRLTRVGDRHAKIFYLQAKDKFRWSYKFWIDNQTNLILKTQILNYKNEVLEQKVFSEIHYGPLPQEMKSDLEEELKLTNEHVDQKDALPNFMPKLANLLPIEINGFKQRAKWTENLNSSPKHEFLEKTDQAFYWDGLSSVSVFIKPDAHTSYHSNHFNLGATRLQVEKWHDNWITVVGEVPDETLRSFLTAIKSQKL